MAQPAVLNVTPTRVVWTTSRNSGGVGRPLVVAAWGQPGRSAPARGVPGSTHRSRWGRPTPRSHWADLRRVWGVLAVPAATWACSARRNRVAWELYERW